MKIMSSYFQNYRSTCQDKYLTENGDLERAVKNSETLCQLCKATPEDLKAYSEIHKVIELLNHI